MTGVKAIKNTLVRLTVRLLPLLVYLIFQFTPAQPRKGVTLSLETLKDKIQGGWAGQVIGRAFGGPFEHKYPSSRIPDSIPLLWSSETWEAAFKENPDLYNDLYVELLFLDTLKKKGLRASPKDLAKALSRAQFGLHHGLQMARHNFLAGLKPPKTGHWLNNPHADDDDFQKIAGFIGLISPGMLPPAIKLGNHVGHIIASGDGYYGGIYVACLYSLAFIRENSESIVEEAMRVLPPKAIFTQVISEVLANYRRQPNNWQETWSYMEKKWGNDTGCPEGVFKPLNFDAKINAVWITIGLLYGGGDFSRTINITTRCGDDTKSNAAISGGVIGTLLGLSRIPSAWQPGLKELERIKPRGLDMTYQEAIATSFNLALETIRRNGGRVDKESITLPSPKIRPLPWEGNFVNHLPKERRGLSLRLSETNPGTTIEFEGTGFVVTGRIIKKVPEDYTYRVAMVIDGRLASAAILPAHPWLRNPTPFFRYNLRPGKHRLFLELSEPSPKADILLEEIIVYEGKPKR